jgi:orotate phosphoribosyltransferase
VTATLKPFKGVKEMEILGMTKEEILSLYFANLDHRILSIEEVKYIFALFQAYWEHDGSAEMPHATLTSGLHCGYYFNCPRVLCHSNLCQIFAWQIVEKLGEWNPGFTTRVKPTDWVIGSIDLSKNVADFLGCQHGIPEKSPDGKKQIWERLVINPGERVLRVEELVTTSSTISRVTEGITQGNPHPVEFFEETPVLIYRPAVFTYREAPEEKEVKGIRPVFHFRIPVFEPEHCELCKLGSKADWSPKKHWAQLIG